jgi:NADPH-dependent 2,4-dienoyl-CoA reductase/sulfur reductase-like enzyme
VSKRQHRRLLSSLRGIEADAAHATAADDRALAREKPVFARMLDATIPYMSSMCRPDSGWPKGKKRGTQ